MESFREEELADEMLQRKLDDEMAESLKRMERHRETDLLVDEEQSKNDEEVERRLNDMQKMNEGTVNELRAQITLGEQQQNKTRSRVIVMGKLLDRTTAQQESWEGAVAAWMDQAHRNRTTDISSTAAKIDQSKMDIAAKMSSLEQANTAVENQLRGEIKAGDANQKAAQVELSKVVTQLNASVAKVNSGLKEEEKSRHSADSQIKEDLSKEADARRVTSKKLKEEVAGVAKRLQESLLAEATERKSGANGTQTRIDALVASEKLVVEFMAETKQRRLTDMESTVAKIDQSKMDMSAKIDQSETDMSAKIEQSEADMSAKLVSLEQANTAVAAKAAEMVTGLRESVAKATSALDTNEQDRSSADEKIQGELAREALNRGEAQKKSDEELAKVAQELKEAREQALLERDRQDKLHKELIAEQAVLEAKLGGLERSLEVERAERAGQLADMAALLQKLQAGQEAAKMQGGAAEAEAA
jgi:hypothetical protein